MSKFLLFLLVVGGIWWWRRRGAGGINHGRPVAPRPVERMVACAHCGVYVPESQALLEDGRYFCCPEHRPSAGE